MMCFFLPLSSGTKQATTREQIDNRLLEYYDITMSTEMLKTRLKRQYTAGDVQYTHESMGLGVNKN